MKCPKCLHTDLKAATTKDKNYHLDACPECKGIWFDERELSASLGRPLSEEVPPKYAFEASKTQCPKCHIPLFEYCYPKTTILVDGCKKCHGVWLDDKEWQQIKNIVAVEKNMSCPKCKTLQAASSSCVQCGIFFDKYYQQENAKDYEVRAASERINTIFENAIAYKITQQVQWLEILSPFERRNRYDVRISSNKNHFGVVQETSKSLFNFLGRQLLGYLRAANLVFEDENGNAILTMKKPFRFYFHQIQVFDIKQRKIGTIKRRFHLFRPNYDINDALGKTIIKVIGPFFFIPFMRRIFKFRKKGIEVAEVSKEWRGILKEYFADADSFRSRIDHDLPIKEKILLFAAVFLIDFVSFEDNQGSS